MCMHVCMRVCVQFRWAYETEDINDMSSVKSAVIPHAIWTAVLDPAKLEAMTTEIGLEQAIEHAQALMQGKVRGRIVVKI